MANELSPKTDEDKELVANDDEKKDLAPINGVTEKIAPVNESPVVPNDCRCDDDTWEMDNPEVFRTVTVRRTVTRVCEEITDLQYRVPVRLPAPKVPQAPGGTLDLRAFRGDATVLVERWEGMQAGQKGWLECTGEQEDGTPYTIRLMDGDLITADEVKNGVSRVLPRAELEKYRDKTALKIVFKATTQTCGCGDVGKVIGFPALDLNFRKVVLPKPYVPEAKSGVLDFVDLCCGDARFIVAAWPDIDTSNRIWLTSTGTATGGKSSTTVDITSERNVTAAEVKQGLVIPITNGHFASFANDSLVTLQLYVQFPGGGPTPFNPVEFKLFKSRRIIEGFDGQNNQFLGTGGTISLPTMTIQIVRAAASSGSGIMTYTKAPASGFLTGPSIVMCNEQVGFANPLAIMGLTFNVPCGCLKFAVIHLDSTVTLRFYDQKNALIKTQVVSAAVGRHQWVEFKTTRGAFCSRMEIETGDFCFLDNFSMCCPVDM